MQHGRTHPLLSCHTEALPEHIRMDHKTEAYETNLRWRQKQHAFRTIEQIFE